MSSARCPTLSREVFAIQLRTHVAASEIGGEDISTPVCGPDEALTEKAMASLLTLDLRGVAVAELTLEGLQADAGANRYALAGSRPILKWLRARGEIEVQ